MTAALIGIGSQAIEQLVWFGGGLLVLGVLALTVSRRGVSRTPEVNQTSTPWVQPPRQGEPPDGREE